MTPIPVHARRPAGPAGAVLGGIGVFLLLVGLSLPPRSPPPWVDPPAARSSAPTSGGADAAGGQPAQAATRPVPGSVPVHLSIPSIGVDTDLIPLGLNPDGTVMVPPLDADAPAGWYRYLAAPGDPGPAVLLGHVDTYRGPAVFYRISALEPGAGISVRRADGRLVAFAVDVVRVYSKSDFPSRSVYGQTDEPVLRLVTCGGEFDRGRRSYLSNVVVYARLVAGP